MIFTNANKSTWCLFNSLRTFSPNIEKRIVPSESAPQELSDGWMVLSVSFDNRQSKFLGNFCVPPLVTEITINEARLFYTLFSTLEFWKIFRGWEKIKIKIYFLTICSLSKMCKLKYLSGGQNKNIFWTKICSEMGLNTLILSCFACFGAPYLQWRWCRGWNKNKEKKLFFFMKMSFSRVEVGKKVKNKILFLFQITTFGCRRVR
jgi:hypothetical protein